MCQDVPEPCTRHCEDAFLTASPCALSSIGEDRTLLTHPPERHKIQEYCTEPIVSCGGVLGIHRADEFWLTTALEPLPTGTICKPPPKTPHEERPRELHPEECKPSKIGEFEMSPIWHNRVYIEAPSLLFGEMGLAMKTSSSTVKDTHRRFAKVIIYLSILAALAILTRIPWSPTVSSTEVSLPARPIDSTGALQY